MSNYIYQFWSRGYRELKNEEDTLLYYSNTYKTSKKDNEKEAKKYLKQIKTSEQWARYAYDNNLEFCICKIEDGRVASYIKQDITGDITTFFLDEHKRVFMYYVFRKQSNGMYFCIGMMFWEFKENSTSDDDDLKSWIYTFETDGTVKVIEQEKDAEEACEWTSKRPLNVESNWEKRPEFGEWDGFFKMKRWEKGELDEAFKGLPSGQIN